MPTYCVPALDPVRGPEGPINTSSRELWDPTCLALSHPSARAKPYIGLPHCLGKSSNCAGESCGIYGVQIFSITWA